MTISPIDYALRFGGRCRDCADRDGFCSSGIPCNPATVRAVVEHTLRAWTYGIKHGYMDNPFADTVAAGVVPALRDVVAERRRQVEAEGWSWEHDDEHTTGELAWAAVCYLQAAAVEAKMLGLGILTPEQCAERSRTVPATDIWPWDPSWWKPAGRRRNLVKSAALILAEIERMDRVAEQR